MFVWFLNNGFVWTTFLERKLEKGLYISPSTAHNDTKTIQGLQSNFSMLKAREKGINLSESCPGQQETLRAEKKKKKCNGKIRKW